MNTVMIITGESSGELYGSLLANALKTKCPEINIIGVGGERMKAAGVELISGISSAFGISEAVSAYRSLKESFSRAATAIEKFSPKVIVLIDYPDFNIRLAKIARKRNIKVLYYVSPQVWAWRKGRVKTIAEISDRIAVILPFEEELYKNAGVQCEFVGHPILDEIENLMSEKALLKEALGLKSDRPVLALLPGSRHHELKSLLPVMLDTVVSFKNNFADSDYHFVMPVAPNIDIKKYQGYVDRLESEGVIVEKENAAKILLVADLSVIASGTAALQAAFLDTPMVVIYKLSYLSYFLGKMILDVKYISLINLISGREVVKELIQSKANAVNIVKELGRIISDMDYRHRMIEQFRAVRKLFEGRSPSARVAEMICEMTG